MNENELTDREWRERLTPQQYHILREAGTERPFTGEYVHNDEAGTYLCAGCGSQLFSSETKYHSASGWPSFWDVVAQGNVKLHEDQSLGMSRTEVICAQCGGHLGHLFADGPRAKTGQRYCINSGALDFSPQSDS